MQLLLKTSHPYLKALKEAGGRLAEIRNRGGELFTPLCYATARMTGRYSSCLCVGSSCSSCFYWSLISRRVSLSLSLYQECVCVCLFACHTPRHVKTSDTYRWKLWRPKWTVITGSGEGWTLALTCVLDPWQGSFGAESFPRAELSHNWWALPKQWKPS